MISLEAACDKSGILRSCKVTGHAFSGPMGQDIVCAAVSVLARTAVTMLQNTPGVALRVDAPRRGELYFEADYEASGAGSLANHGAFLLEGFRSVAQEYPVNCSLRIVDWRK
jgi:uncharacterized protein YsxB (DUF464 family)